jgi:glutaredoxin
MSLDRYEMHVPGERGKDVRLYALSTCGWCKKTKALLKDLGVAYSYVDVDLLNPEAKKEAMSQVDRCSPQHSFPTLIVDDNTCVLGYKEEAIRQAVQRAGP